MMPRKLFGGTLILALAGLAGSLMIAFLLAVPTRAPTVDAT